jgi:hypothetical protein
MTEKQRVSRILRSAPGMSWCVKYSKLPAKQRKELLGPIMATTTSPQSKKALRVVIKHGWEELVEMAGSEGNAWRYFCWEQYSKWDANRRMRMRNGKKWRVKKEVFGEEMAPK